MAKLNTSIFLLLLHTNYRSWTCARQHLNKSSTSKSLEPDSSPRFIRVSPGENRQTSLTWPPFLFLAADPDF